MSERVSDCAVRDLVKVYASRSGMVAAATVAALRELLERRAADRHDDNEPITAEWLALAGFGSETINGWSVLLDCESGQVVEMWINHDGEIALGQDDDLIAMTCTPHIRTRGDLRRLWVALTGRELAERRAGE